MGRKKVFSAFIMLGCLVIFTAAYCATVYFRIRPYQQQVIGPVGKLYSSDPVLGYVPTPNADGLLKLPGGQEVPTHHDDDGLRVSLGVKNGFSGLKKPRILFLGDSFTYGDFTLSEHTFAYRTAIKLGGESINGGVNGYGLAQMVLRARRLIPKYKPDYVVVQYSPWLVDRAMSEFGPSYYPVHVPVPYYAEGSQSEIVEPPFGLLDEVESSSILLRGGFSERVITYLSVTVPVFAYDDFNYAWFRLKQALGVRKDASGNAPEVIRGAYAEIGALAQASGGRMLILVLGGDGVPMNVPGELFPSGTGGVNGQIALLQRLTQASNNAYVQNYWRWAGNPLVPVDAHPNEKAHEILAGAMAERILMLEEQRN